MTEIAWWIIGVYLVIGMVVLIVNALPRAQERAVLKLQESVGLSLPERLAEPIRRRLLSSRRSGVIGGMIGVIVSALAIASPASSQWNPDHALILVGGALAGMASGTSVAALRSTRKKAGGLRYARAQAVELDDYIARPERWLARGPVVLAVVSVAVGVVFVQIGQARYTSASALVSAGVLVLVSVSSLIIFELVGRRVVATANHVNSPEELVWEDATRALTLRELATAPTFLGFYGILMSISPLLIATERASGVGFSITSLGFAFVTLAIATSLLVSTLLKKQHFLRRLWPELAVEANNPRLAEVG